MGRDKQCAWHQEGLDERDTPSSLPSLLPILGDDTRIIMETSGYPWTNQQGSLSLAFAPSSLRRVSRKWVVATVAEVVVGPGTRARDH